MNKQTNSSNSIYKIKGGWFSFTSALHSGVTEEDLRASGVMNPSHRRRILENLPKNWNWLAEVKVVRTLSRELEDAWEEEEASQTSRAAGGFFHCSIDAVTADDVRRHDGGGSVLLQSLPYLSLHLEHQ